MNTKLIEAQIHAQAVAQSYQQAVVNFNQHASLAEQSAASCEAARSRMDTLRTELQKAHEDMEREADKQATISQLVGASRQ